LSEPDSGTFKPPDLKEQLAQHTQEDEDDDSVDDSPPVATTAETKAPVAASMPRANLKDKKVRSGSPSLHWV
jgi:hypothetical protein